VAVFKATTWAIFSTNGGNDSMEPPTKVAQPGAEQGWTWWPSVCPRTVDNDVGDTEFKLIDHTPGYGSGGRYWALAVQTANEENAARRRPTRCW